MKSLLDGTRLRWILHAMLILTSAQSGVMGRAWSSQTESFLFRAGDEIHITDSAFPQQLWYMGEAGMNITGAWQQCMTGAGVKLVIVDDPICPTHSELTRAYTGEHDPTACDETGYPNHGMMTAGIAINSPSGRCGVGVSFGATFKVNELPLDEDLSDSAEAAVLIDPTGSTDIFSNSWGPSESALIWGRVGPQVQAVLRDSVRHGRNGKGAVYVWAAGNGGMNGNSCAYDGFVNSIYTIAVAGVDDKHNKLRTGESCSAMFASTYSQHGRGRIITSKGRGSDCADDFGDSSMATPFATGAIALMLQANPDLTWRDVQHIIVKTADRDKIRHSWTTNAAGIKVSPTFGFGMINAGRMVEMASKWKSAPQKYQCQISSPAGSVRLHRSRLIRIRNNRCLRNMHVLEHVEVTIIATYMRRGHLKVSLRHGETHVTLLPGRYQDAYSTSVNWTGMAVTFWGENPGRGQWGLLFQRAFNNLQSNGSLHSWSVTFHGTRTNDWLGRGENMADNQQLASCTITTPHGCNQATYVTPGLGVKLAEEFWTSRVRTRESCLDLCSRFGRCKSVTILRRGSSILCSLNTVHYEESGELTALPDAQVLNKICETYRDCDPYYSEPGKQWLLSGALSMGRFSRRQQCHNICDSNRQVCLSVTIVDHGFLSYFNGRYECYINSRHVRGATYSGRQEGAETYDRFCPSSTDDEDAVTHKDATTVTPVEDDRVTPVEDGWVAPAEDDRVTPIENGRVTPIEDDRVTPIEDDRVTPVVHDRVTPIENGRITPIEDDRVTPIENGRVTPAEYDRVTPVEDDRVIPIEDDWVTPAEDDRVTVVEDGRVTPVEDGGMTPLEPEVFSQSGRRTVGPQENEPPATTPITTPECRHVEVGVDVILTPVVDRTIFTSRARCLQWCNAKQSRCMAVSLRQDSHGFSCLLHGGGFRRLQHHVARGWTVYEKHCIASACSYKRPSHGFLLQSRFYHKPGTNIEECSTLCLSIAVCKSFTVIDSGPDHGVNRYGCYLNSKDFKTNQNVMNIVSDATTYDIMCNRSRTDDEDTMTHEDATTVTPVEDDWVTPVEDGWVTPVEDGRVIPVKDGRVTPVEDGRVIPVEDGWVTPVEDDRVIPVEDGRVTPVEDGRVTPVEDGWVIPVGDGLVTPIDDGWVTTVGDGRVIPVEVGRVTPDEDGWVTLVEDGRVIPVEDGRVIPVEDGRVIPVEDDWVTPPEPEVFSQSGRRTAGPPENEPPATTPITTPECRHVEVGVDVILTPVVDRTIFISRTRCLQWCNAKQSRCMAVSLRQESYGFNCLLHGGGFRRLQHHVARGWTVYEKHCTTSACSYKRPSHGFLLQSRFYHKPGTNSEECSTLCLSIAVCKSFTVIDSGPDHGVNRYGCYLNSKDFKTNQYVMNIASGATTYDIVCNDLEQEM